MNWRNGIIRRYAGTGVAGYSGNGERADAAQLNGPAGLAFDKEGNLFVVEIHNNTVRKIDAKTEIITTVAGCGSRGFDGDGGLAVQAQLNGPEGVFVDEQENIYIADTKNERIRKVDARTGIISTIAGTGKAGYNGDYIPGCEAELNSPAGVVVDSYGNVYFNDYKNDRIRKIAPNGMISTFAGTGVYGYSGDSGPAGKAQINDVYGLAIDIHDNIYIMDSLNFAVRKVDIQTGIISTVVGKGEPGPIVEFERIKDSFIGGYRHPKGTIGMKAPHAVDVDEKGNLFIGDTASNRIRMFDLQQDRVYTIAGNGKQGCTGDGGSAIDACIGVHGLRIDSHNNVFFIDFYNHVVRVIDYLDRR